MKKILFPATARPHLARQKLLMKELSKFFIVDIWEPRTIQTTDMAAYAILCAIEFNNYIKGKEYDYAILRADRF